MLQNDAGSRAEISQALEKMGFNSLIPGQGNEFQPTAREKYKEMFKSGINTARSGHGAEGRPGGVEGRFLSGVEGYFLLFNSFCATPNLLTCLCN